LIAGGDLITVFSESLVNLFYGYYPYTPKEIIYINTRKHSFFRGIWECHTQIGARSLP